MDPFLLASWARSRGTLHGWRRRRVAWALDVTDPGRPVLVAQDWTRPVPYTRRSSAVAPRPAVDNAAYVAGRHRGAWGEMMRTATEGSSHPAATALMSALGAGALEAVGITGTVPAGDLIAVRAHGQWLHEDPVLIDAWDAHLAASLASAETDVCLCCGDTGRLARIVPAALAPTVFGQRGAGDLVLYPTPRTDKGRSAAARTGAGRTASLMCVGCAMDVAAALTDLAEDPAHHYCIPESGSLLLWWDPSGKPSLPLRDLLVRNDPDPAPLYRKGGRLCAMMLSAASPGRLTMNAFWNEPVSIMAQRIRQWRSATAIPAGENVRNYGLPLLHHQLGRWDRRAKTIVPRPFQRLRERELWIAVLSGLPPRQHSLAAKEAIRRDGQELLGRQALVRAGHPPG
ncbi:type I-C CRISPR-associated protein Cas8c/Csd1 [Streptomyces xiamenensis]|uniref:type I-C CRISPR-associated protein Cas8c/Csd1 n=1 Tax=Streptomyces xiamenensis TaxID=408015 RepID=UPI0035DCED0B